MRFCYILVPLFLSSCGPAPLKIAPPSLTLPPDSPAPSATSKGGAASCQDAVRFAMSTLDTEGLTQARRRLEASRSDVGGTEVELRLKDNVRELGEEIRVGLRWRLPKPGEHSARKNAAQAGLSAIAYEHTDEQAKIAAYARSLHLSVRRAKATHEYARELEEISRSEFDREQLQLRAGVSTKLRVNTAQLRLRRAEIRLLQFKTRADNAAQAFYQFMGRPPSDGVCTLDISEGPLADHPTIQAAYRRAQRSSFSAQAESARGGLWPSFVDTHWGREGEDPGRALVQIGIPLFNEERREASVERARAARDVAKVSGIAREVKQALIEAKALLKQKSAALKDLGQLRDDIANTRRLEASAKGQPASEFDRLEMRRARVQLEAQVADLELDVEAAKIRLMRALGRP